MGNNIKTVLLMVGLTVLFVTLGGAIAGESGLYIAFFLAVILNFSAYWFSDRLAIAMTRSKPLGQSQAPELYEMVQRLSQKAGMPVPRLYIMPTDQPNAFATGRNPDKAVISVTNGLLRLLNRDEVEAVLAHELAHIRNRDILIGSMAAVLAGALTVLARMGMWQTMLGGGRRRDGEGGGAAILLQLVAIVLAPIAALLIRMAISRSREYQADATAASITGRPDNLANALLKLQGGARRLPYEVNEATAHMFIVNPLSARGMSSLFSTHPPIEDRVRRLQARR